MNSLWFVGSTVLLVQITMFVAMVGNGKTPLQNYVDSWRNIGTAVKGFVRIFTPEKPPRNP